MQIELSNEELTAIYNGLEYAHEGLDSDMSLMDDESRVEIRKLEELKDRFKVMMDSAQQGSNGDA